MKRKEPQTWTVRETTSGGLIGTYRNLTAQGAISQAVHDYAVTASQFRGWRGLDPKRLTAAVEPQWYDEDAANYAAQAHNRRAR